MLTAACAPPLTARLVAIIRSTLRHPAARLMALLYMLAAVIFGAVGGDGLNQLPLLGNLTVAINALDFNRANPQWYPDRAIGAPCDLTLQPFWII